MSRRAVILLASLGAALLTIAALAFYALTGTEVAVHNGSDTRIESIRIDFAGSVATIDAIEPGFTDSRTRSWTGDGMIKVTITQDGDESFTEFGYVSPGISQICMVEITNDASPQGSCTPQ